MTRPYAEVIGDPIAQSKSPLIHNFWLGKLGIDAEYRALQVKPAELERYFAERRGDPDWRGCNATIPHKQAVQNHINAATEAAAEVGAVNTVVPHAEGLAGHNSDVRGVACALAGIQGDVVALIGNGGAALAALACLGAMEVSELRIVARNLDASKALLEEFGFDGHALPLDKANIAFDNANCVINATPLGMEGAAPMSSTILRALGGTEPGALIFDMVYAPLETPLLKAAKAFDRKTVDGLVMLVEQAREAFFLFFQEEISSLSGGLLAEGLLAAYDHELRELLIA